MVRVYIPASVLFAAFILCGCQLGAKPGSRTLVEAFAPPTPQEAARMALNQDDPDKRFRGTMLLANAPWGGEEVYLRMYEDYADDEVPNIRAAATRALGNHGRPEHVSIIIPNLAHEDPLVRLEAVQSLQRLHDPAAIGPLIARLDPEIEAQTDIRAEAAHALGQYATRPVLQALIEAMDDRSLSVNHNVLASLTTLTGQDFGLSRAGWQSWYAETENPFAGQTAYMYPVFRRDRRLHEYIPFIPPPPNEEARTPVGMPDLASENG